MKPIVKNRLELYNINIDDDDIDETIIQKTTQEFISDHMNTFDIYYSGRVPTEQNKYIFLHQQTLKPYFNEPIDKTNIIIEKNVNDNFEVIIENIDDFQSAVATTQEQKTKGLLDDKFIWEDNSNITTVRFNKTKCSL